jgi:hypothetical protein
LEHGLDQEELRALDRDVRKSILQDGDSLEYPLPWIVYASEFGYRYSGYEYWQTFEEETPLWALRGSRNWMRAAFRRFAEQYRGAAPEGSWAEWFSIIAWPITHAVLPKDLQRQLAQLLYEASYTFGPQVFQSAESLGQHLKRLSHDYTSRFQQFAENVLLLGQIAAALLIEQPETAEPLLIPKTLDRLVRDIEKEQASRGWLSDARARTRRLRLRGLGRRVAETAPPEPRPLKREEERHVDEFGFEPLLLARSTGPDSWQLLVEIPSLGPLAMRYPTYRDVLNRSTGIFEPTGKPIARQGLLFGLPPIALQRWPEANSTLIKYKGCPPGLALVLENRFRMPPGPRWLFKIRNDGQAVFLKSNVVHPSTPYLLLLQKAVERPAPGLKTVDVQCQGIYGLRFDLPASVDEIWEAILKTLGLIPSRTLQVWPAGSPSAFWDDEGRAEWLIGQDITLGVQTDHQVERIVVDLDGHESVIDRRQHNGPDPVYFSLGQLTAGIHHLRLSAIPRGNGEESLEGILVFVVRAPRPWSPFQPSDGPIRFLVNPANPTLEDLWEGRLEINLAAPHWTSIKARVTFLAERGETVLFEKTMSPFKTPITPEIWLTTFEKEIHADEAAQLNYDLAHSCGVELSAGVLGVVGFTCERSFTPLRWTARVSSDEMVLRLIDNSGSEGLEVREYDFVRPDVMRNHPADLVSKGLHVDSDGGLYYAKAGQAEAGIVAIHQRRIRSLSDLRVRPRLERRMANVPDVWGLLELARIWGEAKVSGSGFSILYRRNVLDAIARSLASTLGGASWEQAEYAYLSQKSLEQLKKSLASAPHHRALGAALTLGAREFAHATIAERLQKLADLTSKFVPELRRQIGPRPLPSSPNIQGVWEFALRLGSQPDSARTWVGERLEQSIRLVLEIPVVVRASRFLVLVVDNELSDVSNVQGGLYRGWAWR